VLDLPPFGISRYTSRQIRATMHRLAFQGRSPEPERRACVGAVLKTLVA